MRKCISYIELLVIIVLIVFIVRVWTYKKSDHIPFVEERAEKLFQKGEELIKSISVKPDTYEEIMNYREAIKLFDRALYINPNYKEAWFNKGGCLYALRNYRDNELCIKTEDVIRCLDKAIEIDPDYYYAWRIKGIILEEWEQYKEAIECYEQALRLRPENYIMWKSKGYCLEKLGKSEEAEKSYAVANKYYSGWANPRILVFP